MGVVGRGGEEVEERRHRAQHADGCAVLLTEREPEQRAGRVLAGLRRRRAARAEHLHERRHGARADDAHLVGRLEGEVDEAAVASTRGVVPRDQQHTTELREVAQRAERPPPSSFSATSSPWLVDGPSRPCPRWRRDKRQRQDENPAAVTSRRTKPPWPRRSGDDEDVADGELAGARERWHLEDCTCVLHGSWGGRRTRAARCAVPIDGGVGRRRRESWG